MPVSRQRCSGSETGLSGHRRDENGEFVPSRCPFWGSVLLQAPREAARSRARVLSAPGRPCAPRRGLPPAAPRPAFARGGAGDPGVREPRTRAQAQGRARRGQHRPLAAGARYCGAKPGPRWGLRPRRRDPRIAVSGAGAAAQLPVCTSGLCGEFMCDFDTLLDLPSFLLCQMLAVTVLRDKVVVRIKRGARTAPDKESAPSNF